MQINQKVYSICIKLMNRRHNNINFNKKYKKSYDYTYPKTRIINLQIYLKLISSHIKKM